jgi:HlyD family secretion protein
VSLAIEALPVRRRSLPAAILAIVALAAGCSSEEGPTFETAEVVRGEVVQTVASAAELQPANRVTVLAPVGGLVAELLVGDGDVVAAGDPIVRLESDSIDQQVAQAAAAVDAAETLAGAAAGAGFDLSPVIGAFRSQLDAVFPPLIATLEGQLDAVELAARQLAAATPDTIAPDPDGPGGDLDLEVPVPEVDLDAIEASVAAARARVAETQAGYRDARASLSAAERDAGRQAAAASEAQRAAASAQRDQATLALEAARARVDDLTILAPAGGVVELARADAAGAGVPDAGDLGGLTDQLGGGALPDLGGLLGGGGGAPTSSGPVAQGVDVGAGQPLLTIFDLSGFTARVQIDEIDVVEVAVGQPVTVLVDAFPEAELGGIVTHVALAPERLPAGGSIYPVTVDLRSVPVDVSLRVGLTASAEIEVRRIVGDTVVPTSALLRRGGDEVVHVVRDGIVREVPVRVLAIGDQTAAVDGPVVAGERVVTVGVELVQDGDEFEVGSP